MNLENFEKEIEKFSLSQSESRFAVALSGGADSMALTLLLDEYSKKHKKDLIALIVNHNLREESSSESESVSSKMTDLGIKNKILTWDHKKISSNMQEQAREARLGLLTDYCKSHEIKYLFIAHHKNDVAETFLMNILRGSGVYGMSSIPNMTVYNSVFLLKPLLDFHKSSLQKYLKNKKINWIEDPSNNNKTFLRTKVRNIMRSKEMKEIIPDTDLLVDRLALNAKNAARARTALEIICEEEMRKNVTLHKEGYITLNHTEFFNLNEEIGLKILSSCLITISGEHHNKPRLNSLEGLYFHLKSKKTAKTLWGCEIVIKKGLIYVYREIGKKTIKVTKLSNTIWVWDNRFEIRLKSPDTIKKIESLSYENLSGHKDKILDRIPKKIWKSLPLITTYDNKVYVPFLNTRDAKEFSIDFTPLMSLNRTSFFINRLGVQTNLYS